MIYTKSPIKLSRKDEDIQPWNAEESNMLHLMIDSHEIHHKISKSIIKNSSQEQTLSLSTANKKESHSFNFNTNLRKYQKKKAEDFNHKKEINFIEKNIKGVSEDFMYFTENVPLGLPHKLLQQKHKQIKNWQMECNSTIEPINWSLIMYYQQNKSQRKHKHKDIQSFLRFQSQRKQKNAFKKTQEGNSDNLEEDKYEGNKYQKLLKLREGLRKRNLKSASQSRKIIDRSLNIQEDRNNIKEKSRKNHESLNKTLKRILPKTSQSARNTDQIIVIETTPSISPNKYEDRIIYTSHKYRISSPLKVSRQRRIVL